MLGNVKGSNRSSKVMVLAMNEVNKESRRPITCSRQVNTAESLKARAGGPSLRQPVCSLTAKHKYIQLKHFGMEITKSIFLTKHHDHNEA